METKFKELIRISRYQWNLPILLTLLELGECNISRLADIFGLANASSVSNAVDTLKELGLVDYRIIQVRTKEVYLTDKGKKIAELIQRMSVVL